MHANVGAKQLQNTPLSQNTHLVSFLIQARVPFLKPRGLSGRLELTSETPAMYHRHAMRCVRSVGQRGGGAIARAFCITRRGPVDDVAEPVTLPGVFFFLFYGFVSDQAEAKK